MIPLLKGQQADKPGPVDDYKVNINTAINHPFLNYDTAGFEGNTVIFIGFKNLICDGTPLIQAFGPLVDSLIIPDVLLNNFILGGKASDTVRSNSIATLTKHFLSDLVHRPTIKARDDFELYTRADGILWERLPDFISLFCRYYFFLKLGFKESDSKFVLEIEQRGNWTEQHEGSTFKCQPFSGVFVPIDKVTVSHSFAQAEKDLQTNVEELNAHIKDYVFSNFVNALYHLKYSNLMLLGAPNTQVNSSFNPLTKLNLPDKLAMQFGQLSSAKREPAADMVMPNPNVEPTELADVSDRLSEKLAQQVNKE